MKARRVDENQPAIVSGLRAIGASVYPAHAVGDGFPDLVVGYRGLNFLLEVKNPNQIPSKRRLTAEQVNFHRDWRGSVAVVLTIEEAIAALTECAA